MDCGASRITPAGAPAGVLSELSRLSEILPPLGPGALPQSQDQQFASGRVRAVMDAASHSRRAQSVALREEGGPRWTDHTRFFHLGSLPLGLLMQRSTGNDILVMPT